MSGYNFSLELDGEVFAVLIGGGYDGADYSAELKGGGDLVGWDWWPGGAVEDLAEQYRAECAEVKVTRTLRRTARKEDKR